jgi:hypothetical protein
LNVHSGFLMLRVDPLLRDLVNLRDLCPEFSLYDV